MPTLCNGGLLSWETIIRNKPPSHTNLWAPKLPAPLPGRMKHTAGKTVNQVAPDWEGTETAELCRPRGVCRGQGDHKEQRGGKGKKGHKRACCV